MASSLKRILWRDSFQSQVVSLWKLGQYYPNRGFMTAMERKVLHDQSQKEFYIDLPEAAGERAFLQYEEPRPGVLDLVHTVVPEALRGQSIGKLLAKEAFDFTVQTDRRMILTCTYLQKYYKDNPLPEYTERLLDA